MRQQFGSALIQDLCSGEHVPENPDHIVMPGVIINLISRWLKQYAVSRVNCCRPCHRVIWAQNRSGVNEDALLEEAGI